MSKEHLQNGTNKGRPKCSEKNLSQCRFILHKTHIGRPGMKPGLPWWEATN